jgi:hypothetical protein
MCRKRQRLPRADGVRGPARGAPEAAHGHHLHLGAVAPFKLVDGTEVTHSVFRLNNKAGLRSLIAGRPVSLRYEE